MVCGAVRIHILLLHAPLSPSLPSLVPPPPLSLPPHINLVVRWAAAPLLHPSTLQPLLFNTLQVRSALGSTHRRKLSFKNVSNVVVQLLHSIKYSMEVPFSNMAIPPQEKSTSITKKVRQPPRATGTRRETSAVALSSSCLS